MVRPLMFNFHTRPAFIIKRWKTTGVNLTDTANGRCPCGWVWRNAAWRERAAVLRKRATASYRRLT
jgi:hypothetical protein